MVCQVLNTGLLYSEKAVYLGKQNVWIWCQQNPRTLKQKFKDQQHSNNDTRVHEEINESIMSAI